MELVDLQGPALPDHSTVVTVGVYDGVHKGHQVTIGEVVNAARSLGKKSVVATFDRHPSALLRPHETPKMLCTLERRLELFAEMGVDLVAVIEFTSERSHEDPVEFVELILAKQLGAHSIFVGENFRFGKDRKGDVGLLRSVGERLEISVTGIPLQERQGGVVSSTRIRELLFAGDVSQANELLGRAHEVPGEVIHGDARGGSALGYPTANVAVPDYLAVPGVGIYAGWYRDGSVGPIAAAISVGRRPTFYEQPHEPLVEAHLLDFEGDLYGAQGRVSFTKLLREEKKFDGIDSLKAQMAIDVAQSAEICAGPGSWKPSNP
jgi:riboflavin kinase/FMN adenylyltransferase